MLKTARKKIADSPEGQQSRQQSSQKSLGSQVLAVYLYHGYVSLPENYGEMRFGRRCSRFFVLQMRIFNYFLGVHLQFLPGTRPQIDDIYMYIYNPILSP